MPCPHVVVKETAIKECYMNAECCFHKEPTDKNNVNVVAKETQILNVMINNGDVDLKETAVNQHIILYEC